MSDYSDSDVVRGQINRVASEILQEVEKEMADAWNNTPDPLRRTQEQRFNAAIASGFLKLLKGLQGI